MKNKITFLIIVTMLTIFSANAQHLDLSDFKTIDTSRYVITYKLSMVTDTMNSDNKNDETYILEIGRNMSKFYSYDLFRHDSICTVLINAGSGTGPHFKTITLGTDIYKYSETMTIIQRIMRSYGYPIFEYTENSLLMKWSITNESKTIHGYQCRKAITSFRGREWTAWYTVEIPVAEGPWKFSGLPGLILEASDAKQHYSFSCTGIENKQRPIQYINYYYDKSTYGKVTEELQKFYNDVYEYDRKIFPDVQHMKRITTPSGKKETVPRDPKEKKSLPYNPIELE